MAVKVRMLSPLNWNIIVNIFRDAFLRDAVLQIHFSIHAKTSQDGTCFKWTTFGGRMGNELYSPHFRRDISIAGIFQTQFAHPLLFPSTTVNYMEGSLHKPSMTNYPTPGPLALDTAVSPTFTESTFNASPEENGVGTGFEPPRKKQKRNKPTLSCEECVERKTKVSGHLCYQVEAFFHCKSTLFCAIETTI